MLFAAVSIPFVLLSCARENDKPPATNQLVSSIGSNPIPVPRGISGLELGMTADQIRETFKIDEGEDPLAALLTKYGKPEAGKAVSSQNQELQKQFFRVSVDPGKTGKLPDGVTSADVRATHNIVVSTRIALR